MLLPFKRTFACFSSSFGVKVFRALTSRALSLSRAARNASGLTHSSHAPVLPGAHLLRIAAEAHPGAKVSQFTTSVDLVQGAFYSDQKSAVRPRRFTPLPCSLDP